MVTKDEIITEIQKAAALNNGVPLGMGTFHKNTHIDKSDWYGKYWPNWGAAIEEAGLPPNKFGSDPYNLDTVLEKIALQAIELNKFPSKPELMILRRKDQSFPSYTTLKNRMGTKKQIINAVIEYCMERPQLEKAVGICYQATSALKDHTSAFPHQSDKVQFGYVYLLKHGNHFKIGKSFDPTRRYKEIRIQMPEDCEEIHTIKTDDPSGIEKYWHKRFADKNLKGEWFKLSPSDVKAFKRM